MSVWKYTRRSNNPELCSFRNWGCYKSYLNTVFYLSLHMKCLKQSPPTGPGISVRSSIIMWTQIFRQAAEDIKKRTNNRCTGCSYCMPCPFGVNIPKNFRIWNDFSMYGNKEKTKQAFFQDMDPSSRGNQCQKCGKCELVCPQSISIRKDLEAAFKELSTLK